MAPQHYGRPGADHNHQASGRGGLLGIPWSDREAVVSVSGTDSTTVTLGRAYDLVKVVVAEWRNVSGGGLIPEIEINGLSTASYRDRGEGNADTNLATDWNVTPATISDGVALHGSMTFAGAWSNGATVNYNLIVDRASEATNKGGVNESASSPLDSIRFHSANGNFDLSAEVYGWTVG